MSRWARIGASLLVALALTLITRAPAAAAPSAQGAATHVVRPGETLSSIAARYGTTVSAILSANGIANQNWIYAGQQLTIPGAQAGLGAPSNSGGVHVVGFGESLSSIAARYGTTIQAIASANGLANPNFVYSGQRLVIPGAGAPAAGNAVHVVQRGESLSSIAARYGVSASAIASANGLSNANFVYVGQRLTIPGSSGAGTVPSAPAPAAPTAGRWIDVNLSTQSLVAYEGDTPVYWATVSTGLPATPTVTGRYQIYSKYRSITMSGPGYYLPGVPWTMFFYRGYAIHGAYWHNNFGTPMSHGCINASLPDAEWLYNFASIGTPVVVHY